MEAPRTAAEDDAPSPADPQPGLHTRRWRRSLRALTATGFTLLAAGAVTGGLALRTDADFAAQCPVSPCDPERRDDLRALADRADRYGAATDALLVSGGVVLAVSLTLYLLRRNSARREPPTARLHPRLGAPLTAVWRW